MPKRKLKPIEERDPYAAAVLNAFDEMKEKFPPAEAVRQTPEELAAESRVAELAKRIQAQSTKGNGLEELIAAKVEIEKLNEALQKSFAYSDELGWALDAQNAVNAQLCKEFSGLEWLLREHKAQVFWHAGVNLFVVGEWQYQAANLGDAVALAVKGFKEKAK